MSTHTPPAPPRGGYRGTVGAARFTAQLVALVTPAMRRRVIDLASANHVSQAKIMRAVITAGIEHVEGGLKSGAITAETLA